ncbi:MAG TPA: hypothetical protein VK502_03635 [Candidatus Saccharimonadales bacterium]|nr:hypothetical protein [Candidatus Saccharimonadales bacterium]
MYPNQDQHQYSIDYLNEIAPQEKKPGLDNKKFLMLVGGGLIVAIIAGIFVLSSGSAPGPTQKMQTLAARLIALQKISTTAQKNIKSSSLRGTNSNLTIFLTNTSRDIAGPLLNNGVDVKKIDSKITAAEKGEKLSATLEDARLNAVFDRKYPREMDYQLGTVEALMKDIYASTNSKSLKEFLMATDKNMQPIKKQFEDFTAATS